VVLADASSSQNDNFHFRLYKTLTQVWAFFCFRMTEENFSPEVKLAIEAAARSLGRCEQCRFSLEQKLLKKEFDEEAIKAALDYLESKKYLDDARYASSWIRCHSAGRPLGRIRLVRELCMRGVSREIASEAVSEYFEGVDETELCRLACRKLIHKNKNEKNLIKSLADKGFSYKIIQKVLREEKVLAHAS